MTDRDPDLDRQEIRLPDGRRLVYYRFPDEGDAGGEPPTPGAGGEPHGDRPPTPTLSPAARGRGREGG
jgi:hypothetical protein